MIKHKVSLSDLQKDCLLKILTCFFKLVGISILHLAIFKHIRNYSLVNYSYSSYFYLLLLRPVISIIIGYGIANVIRMFTKTRETKNKRKIKIIISIILFIPLIILVGQMIDISVNSNSVLFLPDFCYTVLHNKLLSVIHFVLMPFAATVIVSYN